jgi:hypothetical protein
MTPWNDVFLLELSKFDGMEFEERDREKGICGGGLSMRDDDDDIIPIMVRVRPI